MFDTCFGCIHDKPGQRSHMGPGGCLEPELESDTETTPPVRTISHECLLQVLLVNFTCASHDFELVPPA